MPKTWVVVAESSRAKIFELDNRNTPLKELEGFAHTPSRAHEQKLTSDLPGRSQDSLGHGSHKMGSSNAIKDHESQEFAKTIGVVEAFDPAQVDLSEMVQEVTGYGADVVVDAVGDQLNTAIKLARRGGHIVLFGLRSDDAENVNQYAITRYDLTIHGTFVGLNPFERTISLLESRQLQPSVLISHRVPLNELTRGIELMRSRKAVKILVEI